MTSYLAMKNLRCSLLLSLPWLLAAAAHADHETPLRPRPISEAERQAVILAVTYFDAGAEGWWQLLAADAPLRTLGQERAVAEIRARLGPAAHATWWLGTPAENHTETAAVFSLYYPSGFDDALRLELAPDQDWKIRHISTRVDPRTGKLPQLAPLLPLRDALAEGRTGELEQLFADPPRDEGLRRIVLLWESQYRLEGLDRERATELFVRAMDGLTAPPPPLAALQRARLRLHQLDGLRTSLDYETALEHGVDYDGLRLEATEAERLLGFLNEEGYRRLGRMGTRAADVYYRLARTAAIYKDPDAEELFRVGYQLEPLERAVIFSDPVLAQLALRPSVHQLLRLDADEDPLVVPPEAGRRPLAFPPDARLRLQGDQLVIHLGDGEIVVPGGGALAPAGTVSEDAATANARREQEILAELDSLAQLARVPEAFTNLRLRDRLETAGLALQRAERWDDLLELTGGMAAEITDTAASLSTLRAVALMKTGRHEEAGRLLVALTEHAAGAKTRDIGPLVVLADLCAEQGRFKTAISLLHKANSELPSPIFSSRIQKLRLEQSIASSNRLVKSSHFRIRYTDALIEAQAINVARDLESEWQRLRAWIPVPAPAAVVEVHLFPHRQFAQAFGRGTLGLFDGKMRIPFLDTATVQVVLSGVLSHELAHAMIKGTTGEAEAPHWFHEGLAQLLEMESGFDHPQLDERRFALSVIETAFENDRGSELLQLAYNESAWLLYFIQDQLGISGIRQALQLFAQGKDGPTVVTEIFGQPLPEVYQKLATWHRSDAGGIIAAKQTARREWEAKQAAAAGKDQTRTYDGRVIPKASFRAPSAADVRELEKLEQELDELVGELADMMLAWHRDYAAKSRQVKKSLRPVVENFRGQARMRLGDSCRQLAVSTRELLADKQVFDCPDERVNGPLRSAYRHFNLAGMACTQGKTALVRTELIKAETDLTSVIRVLEPYGLAP